MQTLNIENETKKQGKDMKANDMNYTMNGCSNEVKAVSGFVFFANAVFENLRQLTIRVRDGQAEMEDRLNREHRVNEQRHQNTNKRMPLEQLIRKGFYPF